MSDEHRPQGFIDTDAPDRVTGTISTNPHDAQRIEVSTSHFDELVRRPEAPVAADDDDLPGAADVEEGWLRLKVAAHRALTSDRELIIRHQSQPTAHAVPDQTWASAVGLMDQAEADLRALGDVIDEIVEQFDQVPEALEAEHDAALERSRRLGELAEEASALLGNDSWEGGAAESYRATARTQAAALSEWAGIESSVAWGQDKSALLVRAMFLEVTQILFLAARRVNGQPSRGVGELGSRAKFVRAVVAQIRKDIEAAVEDVRNGVVVAELADDLTRLLGTPNVVTGEEWPTGDFVAAPADTAAVIPDPQA